MRRFLIAVLFLLTTTLAHGQQILQDAATATGDGTPITVRNTPNVGLYISIADTATVTFEATIDGTTWFTVGCVDSDSGAVATTATASGPFQCNLSGFDRFRARISSHAAGAVTVKAHLSAHTFASGALGGSSTSDSITGGGTTLTATAGGLTLNGNPLLNDACAVGGTFAISIDDEGQLTCATPDTISGGGVSLSMSAAGATLDGGQVLAPAGTNSLPSLSFSVDPDTGLFSATGNRLDVTVGGSTRFFFFTDRVQTNNANIEVAGGSFIGRETTCPGAQADKVITCVFDNAGTTTHRLIFPGGDTVDTADPVP